MDPLVSWFQARGGTFDESALMFTEIEGHGRGALALRDLPEGHALFTIPRDLTLSTRTSSLPRILGFSEWKKFGLDSGWAGLMLCMMWEEAQGASSKWSGYIESLPKRFDTPMFWSEGELEELKGTSVVDKIGKDQAENDYREKVLPALQSRPDLFPPDLLEKHYSLHAYHLMGSRILSRSFQVEKWEQEQDEKTNEPGSSHQNPDSMNVDEEVPPSSNAAQSDEAEAKLDELLDDDSDDENEDSSDVAMVPMADMLNARYESENAKLFYEERDLRMVTTKAIFSGEQIWNTYGDPPNSDLLRRYGHVDLVPIPQGGLGNPADIVEVRADLAVAAVSSTRPGESSEPYAERVDWWLEEGGDDVFVLETNHQLPDELVSFMRLLILTGPEWEKTKAKSKLPKPKVDDTVLSIAADVLNRRLSEYSTTLEEDEKILADPDLKLNRRHAVIVRLGEKRIIQGTVQAVKKILEEAEAKGPRTGKKRKADDSGQDKRRSKR